MNECLESHAIHPLGSCRTKTQSGIASVPTVNGNNGSSGKSSTNNNNCWRNNYNPIQWEYMRHTHEFKSSCLTLFLFRYSTLSPSVLASSGALSLSFHLLSAPFLPLSVSLRVSPYRVHVHIVFVVYIYCIYIYFLGNVVVDFNRKSAFGVCIRR